VPDEVERLTAAMAAGDAAAVEAFYRRYFDLMYAHAIRLTGRDESFCLDVVQESMLRVIRSVRRVRCREQLVVWLQLVVQTTAYDALRGEMRRQRREAAVGVAVGAAAPAQEQTTDDEERVTWLRQQIASFDPSLVRLIELRYQRGWTLARVAQSIGVSIGTIDGRLRRALRELRRRATEQGHD